MGEKYWDTLELLAGMYSFFDHPELSSDEQGRKRMCKCCVLFGEMLDSCGQDQRCINGLNRSDILIDKLK